MTGQTRHTFRGHRGSVGNVGFSPDCHVLAATGGEAPLYLWDVAGELVKPSTPPALASSSADLASPDAKVAFQAIRRLAWFPDQSLPLLREKLPAVAPSEAVRVTKAIADLDAPAFTDREAAVKDLKALGDLAMPQLEATLKKTESAEVRERIEKLLAANAAQSGGSDGLRAGRAVEAVEWIGTPTAHALLKTWASGAAGARLTREAAEALRRVRR